MTTHHGSHRNRYRHKRPDEVLADWTIAVAAFTGVLAVASIAGDIFSYRTLKAINGQLKEMQDGSSQTDKIIKADNNLAAAAYDQAVAADNLAKTTRENISLAQRAWVGPVSASISVAKGMDAKAAVVYQNTGKEPAFDLYDHLDAFVSIPDDVKNGTANARIYKNATDCKTIDLIPGSQVVYPTSGFGTGGETHTVIDKSKIDDAVIGGTNTLFITGCLAYQTYEKTRYSAFCFFYRAGTTDVNKLNFCSIGAYAD